jgi:quercetin dioxygenase-like cupin family protein
LSDEDEGARILGSAPPANGSRFTMMEFQPGNAAHLHRTDTVDYVICVTGEIDMFLDDTQFITLRAGDVLIQRGTYHAWANRSDKPCRIAVVLLDALPKREGSISGLVSAR